jgi:hypothetical protein
LEKYGHRRLYLKAIKDDDQFFDDISENTGFFSLETFSNIIKIGKIIEEKHRHVEESLAEILGN